MLFLFFLLYKAHQFLKFPGLFVLFDEKRHTRQMENGIFCLFLVRNERIVLFLFLLPHNSLCQLQEIFIRPDGQFLGILDIWHDI